MRILPSLFFALLTNSPLAHASDKTVVGSKAFTEGYLLGELTAQTIEDEVNVTRRFGLGGTGILFAALRAKEVDFYVEYTGTILETILKSSRRGHLEEIRADLEKMGLTIGRPLGFNNTYALAITTDFQNRFRVRTLSEFARVSDKARFALSHEFVERKDGFRALARRYEFRGGHQAQSLEHSLAYEAIRNGQADVIDVYSTDAKIEQFHLVPLEDDLGFFPRYEAVILARLDWVRNNPEAWRLLAGLEGQISEQTMRQLNTHADIEHQDIRDVISKFRRPAEATASRSRWVEIGQRSREHIVLVGIALLFSVVVGMPLGYVATRNRVLGQSILLASGLVQTVPSLALLCFLIPVFGIGQTSALVALCLYGLLPVVLNTFAGLRGIDPQLIETARALKLGQWPILFRIQIPLASRAILNGVRTSAVIGIGTATLAALIGAGGYGASIVSGLALNDLNLILMGAVPAAIMALFAHGFFEILNFCLIPKGLK